MLTTVAKLYQRLITETFIEFYKRKGGFDAEFYKKLTVTEIYQGSCEAIFKVDENVCNEFGNMANGLQIALMDVVTTIGITSLFGTRRHVSVTLSLQYCKPPFVGDDIVVISRLMTRNDKLIYLETVLKNKSSGDLLAKGKMINYVLDI